MDTNKPAKVPSRKAQKYRGVTCQNCSHPLDLSDVYCAYCSQLNSTKKLTVGDFFEEFFSSILSWDSRFNSSIKTLIFKPGVMSREFMNGKRRKYVNPFRMYLSVSILFFIILGFISNFDDINFDGRDAIEQQLNNGIDINVDGIPIKNIQGLDSIINAQQNQQQVSLDSVLKQFVYNKKQHDSIKTYKDYYLTEANYDTMTFFGGNYKRFDLYQRFHKETEMSSARRALDSLSHNNTTFNRWVFNKAVDSNTMSKEPGALLGYFLQQLPFVIFFFIPIFTLFVWLVYFRRRKNYTYTDHLIFLFHTQTMFFVLYGIAIIIDAIFGIDISTSIAMLVFLFYLYKAMRNFYKQGRFKTIVKFLILNTIFFILATFGAVVAFAISFATY